MIGPDARGDSSPTPVALPRRWRGFGYVVGIVLLWNAPLLILSIGGLVWMYPRGSGGRGEEGALAAVLVAVVVLAAVTSLVSGLVVAVILTAAGVRQRILVGMLAGAAGWVVTASVFVAPFVALS
jgi:hypothetical protein